MIFVGNFNFFEIMQFYVLTFWFGQGIIKNKESFMKVTVNHPVHGEIVFEENFWTGKKKLSVNGKKLQKVGKKTFAGEGDKTFFLEGNFLTGNRLQAGNEEIVLTPALKWYEVVLSVLPFLLILIWGNSVALCNIVPVVGGAIGGGMGAIFGMTNVMLIKSVKNVFLKILISLGITALTFLAGYLVALAVLSAL